MMSLYIIECHQMSQVGGKKYQNNGEKGKMAERNKEKL